MQLEIQSKEISSQQEYLEDRESLLQVNSHAAARIFHIFNTEYESKRCTCTFTYIFISNFSYCRIKKTTETLTVFIAVFLQLASWGKLREQFVPSNSFCTVSI